jgi:hypothetical protein
MHKALTKEKNNLVFIIHEKKILGVMLLNTTFDNISVISWQSFLLLEYLEKTIDLPQVTDKKKKEENIETNLLIIT